MSTRKRKPSQLSPLPTGPALVTRVGAALTIGLLGCGHKPQSRPPQVAPQQPLPMVDAMVAEPPQAPPQEPDVPPQAPPQAPQVVPPQPPPQPPQVAPPPQAKPPQVRKAPQPPPQVRKAPQARPPQVDPDSMSTKPPLVEPFDRLDSKKQ